MGTCLRSRRRDALTNLLSPHVYCAASAAHERSKTCLLGSFFFVNGVLADHGSPPPAAARINQRTPWYTHGTCMASCSLGVEGSPQLRPALTQPNRGPAQIKDTLHRTRFGACRIRMLPSEESPLRAAEGGKSS